MSRFDDGRGLGEEGYDEERARRQAAARARLAQRQQRERAEGRDPALDAYRASAYAGRKPRRSKLPFVVGGLAVVVVAVAAILAFSGVLAPSGGSDSQGASSAPGFLAPANDVAGQVVADDVIMTLGGSADTYVLVGEDYLEAGCHAVDPEEGDITSTVEAQGEVDTSRAGDYVVTYTAKTSDGAVATKERTVHVMDSFDAFGGNAASLPVLMYHYVYTESDVPDDLNGNYLLDTKLEAQLQYLTESGYYYPSYQEVKAYAEGTHTLPARSVVLTFDDGETGFLAYGIPLLEKYQVPATSFVICNDSDASEKVLASASEYVSFQSHSYAMHQAGSNVGRGGRIHAMTEEQIADDLRQAQAILGTTEAFAYPFGDNNANAQAALRETGVLCAFTIVNERVEVGDDPTVLPRVRISGEYSQESFQALVAPDAA